MRAICKNSKTYRSLDLSTLCPKLRAGNPCPYCYVQTARRIGCNAKKEYDRIPYRGEILRMKPETIARLNRCGGLRLFSFGDYMTWMDEDLFRIIEDAQKAGLYLKAITKQSLFVERFAKHMRVVNVSVDSIGHGMDHEVAKNLRRRYDNVFVRAAILYPEDIHKLAWADIFTLNHGPNGFYHFGKQEKKMLEEKYHDKLCCITGKCETCGIKCSPGVKIKEGQVSFPRCADV